MEKKLNGMTPQEWLKFNYNLTLGNRIVIREGTGILVNVIEPDNIGHFRTNYPVVMIIDYLTIEPQKITIEEMLGF